MYERVNMLTLSQKIMGTFKDLTLAVGNTPIVELHRWSRLRGLQDIVSAKLEMFNPGGSVKDRAALAMIAEAEARGVLAPGGTIIEPTSGNTGIGLAMVAAVKGYKLIIAMPETMSAERRQFLAALGVQLVLTPGAEGMKGAIAKARELLDATSGAVTLGQFDNPANPSAHQLTTAEEIWRDTQGRVDIFVAGVGTGGTISGVGRGLKAHNPDVKIVAVEPAESPVLSGGKPAPHRIQGIGAGFVPANYDPSVVDRVMTVSSSEAIEAVRQLACTEGILAGISSGAALHIAASLAAMPENRGKMIVTLLPDTGERYLSMNIYQNT